MQSDQLTNAEINSQLEGFLTQSQSAKSCDDASLAARLAVMNDEMVLAKDYTAYLLSKGFFEPEFVAFCKEYQICD